MAMMGSGSGAQTGDQLQQLMTILSDPQAFEERKNVLSQMQQDVNTIMAESAQRKILVDERVKDAQKIEVANNFMKMANDKRRTELEAFEIALTQREKALEASTTTAHASILDRTTALAAQEQAMHDRLNVKKAAIESAAAQLDGKQNAFAAVLQTHVKQKAELSERVKAVNNDISKRIAVLEKQIADHEQTKASDLADLELQREELARDQESHSKSVNNIRALIGQLSAALNT